MSEAVGIYDAVAPIPDAPVMPVGLESSNHCQVYGPVPPVTVDVIACPLSMVVGEGWASIERGESALTNFILANAKIDNEIRNTINRLCSFSIF